MTQLNVRLVASIIYFITSVALYADEMITVEPADVSKVEKSDSSWQLSVIAGGVSKHLTTKYEPEEGYTEQHSNVGVELGQAGPGWVFSAQATWFEDSHGENGSLGVGAFGYRAIFSHQVFIYGGLGAGYVDTSYYSGAIALPYAELGWWRISAQGSYLPELSNADSGVAIQLKFRVIEW